MTIYNREKYLKNKEKILAKNKEWAIKNKDKLVSYRKEYRRKNLKRIKENQKSYRLQNLDKIKAQIKAHRLENLEHYKKQQRENHKKKYPILKQEVLKYYGNGKLQCLCCGESNLEFLTIDHINNDGAAHRKSIGRLIIYNWLKKHNYPSGFQTLCFNCNCGKQRLGGICPHKLIKNSLPISIIWSTN